MALLNPVPGSEVLGWGFNVFGSYSSDSKTRQLFQFPETGATTQPLSNGTTYLLPGNIQLVPRNATTGETQVFQDRSEVETYFSGKAGLSTRIGEPGFKFTGQFDVMYSGASQSETSYTYAMIYSGFHSWDLEILEQNLEALAPWVLNDPDFFSVPNTFTPENAAIFFRFFDKFGTHYVSQASVGWKLYFNEAVSRSFTTSTQTISANASLEYRALFLEDSKATADATWSQVGYDYTQNRTATLQAMGGTSSILNALLPAYGQNHSDLFDLWRQSADANPVAVDFQLNPMWFLFSGAHAAAMEQAYLAYANAHLYAESKTASTLIQVKGKVERPAQNRPEQASGFQVCVIRRSDLEPVFNAYFTFSWTNYWQNWPEMYRQMYAALQNFNSSDYVVTLASFGMMGVWFPTDDMYQFLVSCGASDGLRQWERLFNQQGSANYAGINYILVGIPTLGMGNGLEAYTEAAWSRLGFSNGQYFWSGEEAPVATLLAQLRFSPRTGQVDLLAKAA